MEKKRFFEKTRAGFAKIGERWDACVTKLWFRVLVVALLCAVCFGALLLTDYEVAKKNSRVSFLNRVVKGETERVIVELRADKNVYYQDTDTQADGFVSVSAHGEAKTIPLSEADPSFDLTRAGVHVDAFTVKGQSLEYVYSVLPRALAEDEVPVSISVNGVGVYYLNERADKNAVMTVTTDKGYTFDVYFDGANVENFINWTLGETETQVLYEYNGVRVTAPYTYRIVENPADEGGTN